MTKHAFSPTDYLIAARQTESLPPIDLLGTDDFPDTLPENDWRCKIPSDVWRLTHGAIGIMTEVGELIEALDRAEFSGKLDFANIIEEFGDVSWYVCPCVSIAATMPAGINFDFDTEVLNAYNKASHLRKVPGANLAAGLRMASHVIAVGGSMVLDQMKRHFWYFAEVDGSVIIDGLQRVLEGLAYAAVMTGVDLETIWAINIAKLDRRYKQKNGQSRFTDDVAIARSLDAERALLEEATEAYHQPYGRFQGTGEVVSPDGEVRADSDAAPEAKPQHPDQLRGLYNKYRVTKTSGEAVDPNAYFFIMRLDPHCSVPDWSNACRRAAEVFASQIRGYNPQLADDLERRVRMYDETAAEMDS